MHGGFHGERGHNRNRKDRAGVIGGESLPQRRRVFQWQVG